MGEDHFRMGGEWIVLPLIGALIGWITNRLAVRMLFRPKKEWRVPIVRFSVQGLLPRRHADLARIIGETVERDLMSADTFLAALQQGNYREQVVDSVKGHLEDRINRLLPRFLPQGVQIAVMSYMNDVVANEVDGLIDQLEVLLSTKLKEELSVASIVEERILSLDLDELERLITGVASPELRYIEFLGGVLGGLIGIVQAGIVHFL